ncbi:MAG: cation transporter [Fluviicola sp.]
MTETVFKISKMDCPSEENLIRMKLSNIDSIAHLEFDIPERKLIVFHKGNLQQIDDHISQLNLGSELIETNTTERRNFGESQLQRKLLWAVLIINASFFLIEMISGLLAQSMGLVADSLDMLADSLVYGISLLAVGGTLARKKNIAKLAGYFQITLAIVGFLEVLRRYFGLESTPDHLLMIVVSSLALIANGACLYLLQKSNNQEAHMKASMIFTSNDIIINAGVIVAGLLVYTLHSSLPDLIIGAVVFTIVLRGAFRILSLGK